jgi:hypothetical protein
MTQKEIVALIKGKPKVVVRQSRINLVDLAGSEKVSKSLVTGRIFQGVSIESAVEGAFQREHRNDSVWIRVRHPLVRRRDVASELTAGREREAVTQGKFRILSLKLSCFLEERHPQRIKPPSPL